MISKYYYKKGKFFCIEQEDPLLVNILRDNDETYRKKESRTYEVKPKFHLFKKCEECKEDYTHFYFWKNFTDKDTEEVKTRNYTCDECSKKLEKKWKKNLFFYNTLCIYIGLKVGYLIKTINGIEYINKDPTPYKTINDWLKIAYLFNPDLVIKGKVEY